MNILETGEFDYGEHLGDELIRMSVESECTKMIRENNNLLKALNHVKEEGNLNFAEQWRCIENIAILERQIEASMNWLDVLKDWRIKIYN